MVICQNINKYIQAIFRKHLPSNRTKEHLSRVRQLRCAPQDRIKKRSFATSPCAGAQRMVASAWKVFFGANTQKSSISTYNCIKEIIYINS